jgi:hypothetical protein
MLPEKETLGRQCDRSLTGAIRDDMRRLAD